MHLRDNGASCGCVAHRPLGRDALVLRRAVAVLSDDLSPFYLLCLLRGCCWARPLEYMQRRCLSGFRLGCFLLVRVVKNGGGGGSAFPEYTIVVSLRGFGGWVRVR